MLRSCLMVVLLAGCAAAPPPGPHTAEHVVIVTPPPVPPAPPRVVRGRPFHRGVVCVRTAPTPGRGHASPPAWRYQAPPRRHGHAYGHDREHHSENGRQKRPHGDHDHGDRGHHGRDRKPTAADQPSGTDKDARPPLGRRRM